MASCGGDGDGACQSYCRRTDDEEASPKCGIDALDVDTRGKLGKLYKSGQAFCFKCREEKPVWNGLCLACFRSFLFGKFKLAVTSNAMISPSDKVLVAFSGGPASRVALQFIHEMHCKSLKNWDASKSQGLPVFGFGVAFVDETTVFPIPSNLASNIIEEISGIVSELGYALQELHIAPIETAFCKDLVDGQNSLRQLLDNITDASGKEDFVQYLRMLSLQKIAVDNKYTKLVLGSCTSKMAHQIISATVKGQGFALPADLQYVDTRQEIPVLLPLRDCNAQELGKLCFLDGLKTIQGFSWPPAGINGLVSSFIARLQDENPSRQRTIVRTAEKLKAFSFNKFTEVGYYDFLPSIVRAKFQHVKHEEPEPDFLCPICGSPLSESEWKNVKNSNRCPTELEFFVSQCCRSCNFQILPKETGKRELFYSLLPSSMTDRVKGKDCIGRRCLQ